MKALSLEETVGKTIKEIMSPNPYVDIIVYTDCTFTICPPTEIDIFNRLYKYKNFDDWFDVIELDSNGNVENYFWDTFEILHKNNLVSIPESIVKQFKELYDK